MKKELSKSFLLLKTSIKKHASFVTKTVEEDGIAYAMKELGII